jgi:HD superfamily phosphohydrolase
MVYPGALHTRYHHALGALHLMSQAIETIRSKDHSITPQEEEGASIAILLHDIGHGPFSHALEHSVLDGMSHEEVSEQMMDELNREFNGALTTGIAIFRNTYQKKFLHALVSSQLDMDRLDYLNRDSFYTGVLEGKIGAQRIIKMLDVVNDRLVVEEKGIYSIEKFLIARRLMYWQVYLHKTVLAAEQLLVRILLRAKELTAGGATLFATPPVAYFLNNKVTASDLKNNPAILHKYAMLDDYEITACIKAWMDHEDKVLSRLCTGMINRKLYKIRLNKEPFDAAELKLLREKAMQHFGISEKDSHYFVFAGTITNTAYNPDNEPIHILHRDGTESELTMASDQLEVAVMSTHIKRYYHCILPELV